MFQNREEQIGKLANQEFDFLFSGVNLTTAFLCYALSKEGKRVAICQAGDFNRDDQFQLTALFPKSLSHVFGLGKKLDLLETLRRSFPHLVLQQRVINIGLSRLRSKMASYLYNLIIAKGAADRSAWLELSKYPEFRQLGSSGFQTAILSREYRINMSRLILELLKEAERCGALIINHAELRMEGHQLLCTDQLSGSTTRMKTRQLVQSKNAFLEMMEKEIAGFEKISNPVRIIGGSVDFQISLPQKGKYRIGTILPDGLTAPSNRNDKQLLENIIGPVADQDWESLTKRKKTNTSLPYPNVEDQRIDRLNSLKMPDHSSATKIQVPENPSCWTESGYELNHLSSVGDRLWDEARQTRIDQETFLNLFYRFGSNIREITELAYQRMGRTEESPRQLWEAAVNQYETSAEWKK